MKKIFLLLLIHFSLNTFAQTDVFDDIAKNIKTADASHLAGFFNTTVELSMPGNNDAFSKTQAEMIMKDFFARNSPKNFTINHRGGSGTTSRFANCTLETSSGVFKVYIYMKGNEINELRFER